MKFTTRSAVALAIALASQGVWSADTYLHVFYGESPLQGVEVKFDGQSLGETDARGASSVETRSGEHTIELFKDNEKLASINYSTEENQDAEINITFQDGKAKPVVSIEKFAENDNSATGSIGGRITNANGEPIVGAKIIEPDGPSSVALATSNQDGLYEITLPRGSYNLEISHPEYATAKINDIRILANIGTIASIKLRESVQEQQVAGQQSSAKGRVEIAPPIEEVLTIGTYKPADSSMSIERFSTKIVDAIDAESISRFGDANVAAALNRVVGVTINRGKYANVRGLDGRYISSTFNGMLMPSTDPLRRDVQLDLFPANILDGIEVKKSYVTSLSGATTGGSVDITTKGLPEERVAKIGISTAYSSFTGDDIVTYEGSNTDWIGYDSGLRDLPNRVLAATEDSTGQGFDPGFEEDCNDVLGSDDDCIGPITIASYGLQFQNDYNIKYKSANPDFGASLSYGDLVSVPGGDIGYYGALSYKYSTKNREDAKLSDIEDLVGIYMRSQENTSLSAYFVAGYQYRSEDEILSKTTFLRNSDNKTSFIIAQEPDDDFASELEATLEWVEREFLSQQFSGKHVFDVSGEPHELNWQAGISKTERYEPDRRTYKLRSRSLTPTSVERRWSDLHEESVDFSVDYKAPFSISDSVRTELTVGALYSDRSRDVTLYRFGFRANNAVIDEVDLGFDFDTEVLIASGNDELYSPDIESVLSYENIAANRLRIRAMTTSTDSYNSDEEVEAVYLSSLTELGDYLSIQVGFRYEEFFQELLYPNDDSVSAIVKGRRRPAESNELLPALNLTFHVTDDIQLRAAWSKTVSYPGIVERSESLFFHPETDDPIKGDPTLEAYTVNNFDLRGEYYFSDEESVSLALFSKDISRPIEQSVIDGSGATVDGITFRQNDGATLVGVEIDAYKTVLDLSNSSTFVAGNITFIESEVDLSQRSLELEGPDDLGRELQGQSPFLANLQIGYDHYPTEQKITLLYNYFDDRIYRSTRGEFQGPEYEEGRARLDLNYEVLFAEALNVKLQLKNLLNEEVAFSRDGKIIESYKEGTKLSLKVSYEF